MGNRTEKHSEFIRLVGNGMNQTEAYKATVGNPKATTKAAKGKASSLAKKYKAEIAEIKARNKEIADAADKKALEEAAKFNIISAARRQEILSLMAEGKLERKETFTMNGTPVEKTYTPDFSDRRNAIAELNKMTGDHAPTKSDVTLTDVTEFYLPKEKTDES